MPAFFKRGEGRWLIEGGGLKVGQTVSVLKTNGKTVKRIVGAEVEPGIYEIGSKHSRSQCWLCGAGIDARGNCFHRDGCEGV